MSQRNKEIAHTRRIPPVSCVPEADARGVVEADVEPRVPALVRREVFAVEEQGGVVEHALEVDIGSAPVRPPRLGQPKVLAVPGGGGGGWVVGEQMS